MKKVILFLIFASLTMSIEAQVSHDDKKQDFISSLDKHDWEVVKNARPTTKKVLNDVDGKYYTIYEISKPLIKATRKFFQNYGMKKCADPKTKIVYLTKEEAKFYTGETRSTIARKIAYQTLLDCILEWEKLYGQYNKDRLSYENYKQVIASKDVSEINLEEIKSELKSREEQIKQDIKVLTEQDQSIHKYLLDFRNEKIVLPNDELYTIFKPLTIESNREKLKKTQLRKNIISFLQKSIKSTADDAKRR